MHSLAFPVATLVAAMLLGWGKRLRQRRLVGLPIGLFCHLILEGSWVRTDVFLWPTQGIGLGELQPLELRPIWALMLMELAGVAVLWWWARRSGELAYRRGSV